MTKLNLINVPPSPNRAKLNTDNFGSTTELQHKCKYCGVMTSQPDEECYKSPEEIAIQNEYWGNVLGVIKQYGLNAEVVENLKGKFHLTKIK